MFFRFPPCAVHAFQLGQCKVLLNNLGKKFGKKFGKGK